MFDVEISGSITIKKQVKTLSALKKVVKNANGNISVVEGNVETFFGNNRDLIFAIKLAEEYGRNTLNRII